MNASTRHFLLLQGPHGPFFGELADALRRTGADVSRIGFNAGDGAFWKARPGWIGWHSSETEWGEAIATMLADKGITDLVVYGDTRPRHATALTAAKRLGLRTHILEEGYLRPYWITYERSGANGASPLIEMGTGDMERQLGPPDADLPECPTDWGDLKSHVLWGAIYHAALLVGRKKYPTYTSHRDSSVAAEARRYGRRAMSMPVRWLRRSLATRRLLRRQAPFHLALLQLPHDSNFLDHGPFPDQTAFLDAVLRGFAAGAPRHHHLVVKAHPLEDGRIPLLRRVRELASVHGIADRVVLIDGGKLAPLLRHDVSAVTVNSTAGQQVLWRGLPLRIFGQAVYGKSEFVSDQPLPEFFANPDRPDRARYLVYRRYLLATSQIPGGFYGKAGRRRLLRHLPDLMLAPRDRYATLSHADEAQPQHLRRVL